MNNFYEFDILPIILEKFKISRIMISGLSDENLIKQILKYNAHITGINTEITANIKTINGNVFNVLQEIESYDAIFLDDDPNWYTTFNELQIIKKTNKEFPLVFICNNKFPYKFRDGYSDPDSIPSEYRQEYLDRLPILYENKEFHISDGLYHACTEKTKNNGVSTAIENFLEENDGVKIIKIDFIEDITILCANTTISNIRIDKIFEEINDSKIENIQFSDKLVENKLLLSYITQHDLNNESSDNISIQYSAENGINDIHNMEIEYKNSQIESFENEINLKDAQIKKFEYSMINKENEITYLQEQLQNTTKQITRLKNKMDEDKYNAESEITSLQEKLQNSKNQVNYLRNEINTKETDFFIRETNLNAEIDHNLKQVKEQKIELDIKNEQLKIKENELKNNKHTLAFIKSKYTNQISEIDNKEYCISCFKEEIHDKNLEINYLKKRGLTKKLLAPVSYIYLIFKSKPKEMKINLKLYKILKNSKCFDIGYYLNKNKDIQDSLWTNYLSPELHYICYGFSENREFNKKYFNRKSKNELLNYLLECGEL